MSRSLYRLVQVVGVGLSQVKFSTRRRFSSRRDNIMIHARWLAVFALAVLPFVTRADQPPLVHEGIVEAPVGKVWKAFTTKEGMQSWCVAHADIDLRIGGKM